VPVYEARTACRVCGKDLEIVLDLGEHYLPRWIPQEQAEELKDKLPKAPLRLARCTTCGLLQLADSIEPDLVYRKYWYRSGINASMQTALLNLVRDAQAWHTSGKWLDIGANDGTLLKFVPRSFERFACEPALDFTDELRGIADYVTPDYFKASPDLKDMKVITSAAMFYDVDQPDDFVEAIAQTLAPDGVWLNQLNDAPAMIAGNAWDGICHEHNLYYDLPNLDALYKHHGLKIMRVTHNDVNGGSMRVTAARTEHKCSAAVDIDPRLTPTPQQVIRFSSRAVRWKQRMSRIIDSLPKPIYGYGASTKGGTLLQYLDAPGMLKGVAERNPLKYGTVQSGVWSPIISEDEMRACDPGTLFVLPWTFRKEFVDRETEARAKGTMLLFPLPHIELVL
jgi:hypothetical protein